MTLLTQARPYETASTVLTSNKGFEDWGEVFGDDVMAAARIDRLLHHCHVVSVRGNTYRMRHHTDLFPALPPPFGEGNISTEAEEEPPGGRDALRLVPPIRWDIFNRHK